MKHFWKINIYEIQAMLYWIIGLLILHLGTIHWLGWISIGWGWITFAYIFFYASVNAEELRKEFSNKSK